MKYQTTISRLAAPDRYGSRWCWSVGYKTHPDVIVSGGRARTKAEAKRMADYSVQRLERCDELMEQKAMEDPAYPWPELLTRLQRLLEIRPSNLSTEILVSSIQGLARGGNSDRILMFLRRAEEACTLLAGELSKWGREVSQIITECQRVWRKMYEEDLP